MPSRRQFLAAVGASTAVAAAGCTGPVGPTNDSVPGPEYPPGTLWVYNMTKSSRSVTVETVDHSPAEAVETVVPSGETAVRREFVSAPAGTTVTLRARVASVAEDWLSFSFAPGGSESGDGTPPQYARLHVPGEDGEVGWQSRAASQ